MDIEERLRQLTQTPGHERAAVIRGWFPRADHRIRRIPRWDHLRPCENFILQAPRPRLVIGAHHDIDPGTQQGALDNAASVATLAYLAARLGERGDLPDVEICFWDYEEPGNGGFAFGSTVYASERFSGGMRPEMVIVCDVLGLGEPLISANDNSATMGLVAALRENGPPPTVMRTPQSDNISFRRAGIPAALMASIHPRDGVSAWRYLHSRQDTIDKVDVDSLYRIADRLEALAVAMHQDIGEVPWRNELRLRMTPPPQQLRLGL